MKSVKKILIALLHSLNICIFLLIALLSYGHISENVKTISEAEEIRTPIGWSDIPIQNFIFNPFIISLLIVLGTMFGSFYFLIKSFKERKSESNSK